MKTKQQAIQEAYGENWEIVKDCIDDNGWIDNSIYRFTFGQLKNLDSEYKDDVFFRPKSLQGIENNNDWIKIESEDDLPKDIELCFIVIKETLIINTPVFYNPSSKTFCINSLEQPWSTATHYQPIEKPKTPIF